MKYPRLYGVLFGFVLIALVMAATTAVHIALRSESGVPATVSIVTPYRVSIRDVGVFTDRLVLCDRVVSTAVWGGRWECWQRDRLVFAVNQSAYTVEMLDPAKEKSEYIRDLNRTETFRIVPPYGGAR